ncbi:MAG: DnaJ domain-containing protein [Myxococcales bacterium]|nr:DnaJ domain-containing protein [Myxococcales bacterium]
MSAVPDHVRLEETPFPRVLLDLYTSRFSGSVTLSRDRVGKRFLFQEGIPIFAESTLPSESLGVQLMDTQTISRTDYSRVVTYVQRNHCKEGKALLDLGLIDAKGLFVALKEQVRIRLLECFGWPNGELNVDDRTAPPADAQPFRSDVYRLLQEGIATHWSSDRILGALEERMARFPRPTSRFEKIRDRLACDEVVSGLVEALDGSITLWKVLQLAKSPQALAAAWVLDASGSLEYADHAIDTAAEAPEDDEPEVEILFGDESSEPVQAATGPKGKAPEAARTRASEILSGEIEARFEGLESGNPYTSLGVEPDADPATIKRVYLAAAKTYHPDALARQGVDPVVRAMASKVFGEISKAYAVLSDSAKRADYDASLDAPGAGIDIEALTQAETLFRKGEILIQAGNFAGALDFLRPAVEIWPHEGAYQAGLGWALYKKRPSEPEAALEVLERAADLEPSDGVTQFRLSVVLRSLGDTDRAAEIMERARSLEL